MKKKIKLIECPYCGKTHTTQGLCSEKKLYSESFTSFLKEKKVEVIHLHTKDGLAAKEISLEIAKIFNRTTPAIMKYKAEHIEKSVQDVRDILKEANVYERMSKATNEKRKATFKTNYGVVNYGQTKASRSATSKRNRTDVFLLQQKGELQTYKRDVERFTRRSRRIMPQPVVDYYTGLPFIVELMDPGLMQGDLYPTIDHKDSVWSCFAKGLSAKECSDVSNLCWTYRYINSVKGTQDSEGFIAKSKDFFVNSISPEIDTLIRKGYTIAEENK